MGLRSRTPNLPVVRDRQPGFWSRLAAAFRPSQPDPWTYDRIVALVRADEARRHRESVYTREFQHFHGIVDRQIGVKLRWTPADRERILGAAETGDFYPLGLLLDAMHADGLISGIMATRAAFLRLPIQWRGDPFLVDLLKGSNPQIDKITGVMTDPGFEGDFDKMFPQEELASILWDGDLAGVGIGEFVPQKDGPPKLMHRQLHWLRWEWGTQRWVYQTPVETVEIRPGDGRWFLYLPYGESRPWVHAKWLPCMLPFVAKQDATLDALRWQRDAADPLKLIKLLRDQSSMSFDEALQFIEQQWHRSPGLVLRDGEDATLVESSGEGYQVFKQTTETANNEIAMTLAGQTVTSTGTAGGWSKGDIWANIATSITAHSATKLADTIVQQGLKPYARAWRRRPIVWLSWDLRSPEQKLGDAKAMKEMAESIAASDAALKERGYKVDIDAITENQGFVLPIKRIEDEESLQLAEPDVLDAEYEIPVDDEGGSSDGMVLQ